MNFKNISDLAFLFFLFMGASACAIFNKTAGKAGESSRTVAAAGNYMESSQNFSQETARQKQALLRKIKQGKTRFSKAIALDDKGQPICGIDLRNRQDLTPHFAKAAPARFRSAWAFKKGFPSCGPDIKRNLSYRVSQRDFVLEGTQTALAPLALWGLGAAAGGTLGCGVGFLTTSSLQEKAKTQNPFRTAQQYSATNLFSVLVGGIAGAVTSMGPKSGGIMATGGALGMLSGALGFLVCGGIAYIAEEG